VKNVITPGETMIKTGNISVQVKTNSPKTQILSFDKNIYKIAIKATPDKGRANAELVKFIRKLTKKQVTIVSGLKSKKKILQIQ